ncbi:hypothetical protein [Paenibacillus sp. PCH8]|uniref:hypothetical protein n=1 Tax=Paenibacillus sp. PCH8 TaxID=2066524 RepID=UPI0015E45E5C|nr:hypothetical protein [Paenibacillus sp. PCH8]
MNRREMKAKHYLFIPNLAEIEEYELEDTQLDMGHTAVSWDGRWIAYGSLRPFRGQLHEENFHELMEILRVLAPELARPSLDREVMACMWSITHLTRAWAIEPEGMLRSNHLISDEQVVMMEEWLNLFSYAVMILIEGGGEEEAFWEYQQYVHERRYKEGGGKG